MTCPRCDERGPADLRFCTRCGAALTGSPFGGGPPPLPPVEKRDVFGSGLEPGYLDADDMVLSVGLSGLVSWQSRLRADPGGEWSVASILCAEGPPRRARSEHPGMTAIIDESPLAVPGDETASRIAQPRTPVRCSAPVAHAARKDAAG